MSTKDFQAGPLLLEDRITLNPGETGALNRETRLKNPFRAPWYLDEIRFMSGQEAQPIAQDGVSTGIIRAKLDLAAQELTRNWVPLWSFGKVLNDFITDDISNGAGGVISGGGWPSERYASWVLPRPLFIPQGEWPRCQLWHTGKSPMPAATVRVSFVGRILSQDAPYPDEIHFPWVGFYETAAVTPGNQSLNQKSKEFHLANPFGEELHVERFVGRVLSTDGTKATDAIIRSANFGEKWGLTLGQADAALLKTTVKMYDSMGHILVRDPTPFGVLFSVLDRAWTCKAKLPPHSFVIATVNQDYSALTGAQQLTAHISMVGYRTVKRLDTGHVRRDLTPPQIWGHP